MDSDNLRSLGDHHHDQRSEPIRLHPNTRCSNPRILDLLRRYGIAETEDLGDLDTLDPDKVVEVIERILGSSGARATGSRLHLFLHGNTSATAARESAEAVERDNQRLRANYPYLFR